MEWDESTKALINDVAKKAAHETVQITLTGLGVDARHPLEAQADFQFIRAMRLTWQSAKTRGFLVALALMVTGFFSFLWSAIKSSAGMGHH